MSTIRDLIKALNAKFPLSRAEKWDRVGLQIGDENARLSKVLVAHEATDKVLAEAAGFDALLIYHPLLFRPLENLDFKNHSARLAARCIAQNLNVIAAHTALDNAPMPRALGDALAAQLGLENVQVLSPSGRVPLWKIVVSTPPESLEKVSAALWEQGAGGIGNYEKASFRMRGAGTFQPQEGADPYEGEVGKFEEVDEWRLEVIVPDSQRDAAVAAMIQAHPYEEVAYDVYPLYNTTEPYGAARRGELPASTLLADFAQQVQRKLNAPNVRIVRARDEIKSVACVAGSGASYIDVAAQTGIDCLVTGDIKHHDALKAQALDISLIDVTHVATERAAIEMLFDAASPLHGVEIARCEIDTNPFTA